MIRKISLLLLTAFFIFAALFGSFIWDSFFIAPGPDASTVEFIIEPGLSLKQISFQLKEKGLINSRFMFETYARISGSATSFQAGTFTLQTGMSYASLIDALTQAKASEVEITIPEGYRLDQIKTVVQEALPAIDDDQWNIATGNQSPFFETHAHILGSIPKGQGLEGYLFPDTYRFHSDAGAFEVVEVMIETLERRLRENNVNIPEDFIMDNGMTFHEVMTLASIVEREAQRPEDMRMVAGIFLNRLEIGMPLQSDATVTYITGGKDPSPTIAETEIQHPYNTYVNLGLPPGPVSHPGVNAILAVLEPAESDYLYFLTTPEGEFIYSRTFYEHVQNKNRYLK